MLKRGGTWASIGPPAARNSYMEPLADRVRELDPKGAADALADLDDPAIAGVLAQLNPGQAVEVLEEFSPERRQRIAAGNSAGAQWLADQRYPEGTVGRLMAISSSWVRASWWCTCSSTSSRTRCSIPAGRARGTSV